MMADVTIGRSTAEVTVLLDRSDLALIVLKQHPELAPTGVADRLVLTHVDRAAMHDDKLVRICMLLTEGETDE
jgi:hypothetical protein